MSPRLGGTLLIIGAACCWSLGGIFTRLTALDGFTIVFFRSIFLVIAVGLGLELGYRQKTWQKIKAIGKGGILSACLLAATFCFYILSLTHTSVANTVVIMSMAPLVAAFLAFIFLKEKLEKRALIALGLAFLGMLVMFQEGTANLLGNSLAFGVAIAFGANIVVLRRFKNIDMVPANMLAGIIAAVFSFPMANVSAITPHNLLILAAMGFIQLGLGLFLFTKGSPRLPVAESGLLTLLESVLAPIWVWVWLGEKPSPTAFAGGILIIMAVIFLYFPHHKEKHL